MKRFLQDLIGVRDLQPVLIVLVVMAIVILYTFL